MTSFAELKAKTRRGKRGGGKKDAITDNVEQEREVQEEQIEEQLKVEEKVKRKRGKRGVEEATTQEHAEPTPALAPLLESTVLPQLASDIKSYLVSIERTLRQPPTSPEDHSAFLSAVYREVSNHEQELCGDPEASRILELLLLTSNDFHIRVFYTSIKPAFEKLACNQFASHVVETLLGLCAEISHRECRGESVVESEVEVLTIQQLVLGTCDDMSGRWEMLSKHRYGSHVFRTLLTVLCPVPVDTKALRSNKSKDYQKRAADINAEQSHNVPTLKVVENRTVPTEFCEKINEIAKEMLSLDQRVLCQLAIHPVASPLLQLLLPHSPSISTKLLFHEDLHTCTDFIHILAQDRVGSHLLERIIPTLSPASYEKLFKEILPRIVEYAHHALSNFCVQALIKSVKAEHVALQLVTKLAPEFAGLLKYRQGVVIALSAICKTFPATQSPYFAALLSALSSEKSQVFSKTLRLNTPKPNLQGSLLIQNLMRFSSGIAGIFMHSFVGLGEDVVKLTYDSVSSRAVEAVFSSTLSVLQKDSVAKVFMGVFGDMACDKSGSHVLDAVFAGCSVDVKEVICGELAEAKEKIQKSHFGRFCLVNCGLENWERRYDSWRAKMEGGERVAGMFDDILKGKSEEKRDAVKRDVEKSVEGGREVEAVEKKVKKVKAKQVTLDKIFYPAEQVVEKVKEKKEKKDKKRTADDSMDFLMDAIKGTKKLKGN